MISTSNYNRPARHSTVKNPWVGYRLPSIHMLGTPAPIVLISTLLNHEVAFKDKMNVELNRCGAAWSVRGRWRYTGIIYWYTSLCKQLSRLQSMGSFSHLPTCSTFIIIQFTQVFFVKTKIKLMLTWWACVEMIELALALQKQTIDLPD